MNQTFSNMLPWLLAGALCLAAGLVKAADDIPYNLKVTGTIVGESCDVSSNSQNQTVNIGDFAATDFPSIGSTTAEKEFDINLTGCTAAIVGSKVMFSGTADAHDPTLLALSDTAGAGGMASGLGVEILDSNKQALAINNTDSPVYALQAGDNTLPFYLRYKSTAATVTSGNATAVMYFDLQYQ